MSRFAWLYRQEQGPTPSPRNPGLDGLRGIAVTLTLLVHYCGTYMATFRGANPNVVTFAGWPVSFDKVMYWLFRSHHGVYIFFMLSGFLIAKVSLGPNFSPPRRNLWVFDDISKPRGTGPRGSAAVPCFELMR